MVLSIDILNDPAYAEYVDAFRANRQQSYAATELAYLDRGLNGEPELLKVCGYENIKLYKDLLLQAQQEYIDNLEEAFKLALATWDKLDAQGLMTNNHRDINWWKNLQLKNKVNITLT